MLIDALLEERFNNQATMPLHWTNAHASHAVWPRVDLAATPPHPYKPLELWAKPLSHRPKTFIFIPRVRAK